MKLIPNIQKELDALMADPLNYQDPNGILKDKGRSVSDAFVLVEVSDLEVAEALISEYMKTERGKILRKAYCEVKNNLVVGQPQTIAVKTGRREEVIDTSYSSFLWRLGGSINWKRRDAWVSPLTIKRAFPGAIDFDNLSDLFESADEYHTAAIAKYRSRFGFEEALSDSAEYIQTFA